MSSVRKTPAGWVVSTTNLIGDCLEQGGVSGREELYKRETLERLGIGYGDDPNSAWNDQGTTVLDYLEHCAHCDQVLKTGHKIQ